MMDLLDVNGWLALSDSGHTHHAVARDYGIEEAVPEIAVY